MKDIAYPITAIVGPTAVGKTAFSIDLAQHWETEIISADSRQFFKEMTVGTAVPSQEELSQAQHHFIQHLSIQDSYSAAEFAQEALPLIQQLLAQKGRALVVGGSGLYTDALLQGLNDFPAVTKAAKEKVRRLYNAEGLRGLQNQLRSSDPAYAAEVDLENPHRLMRALEVCWSSDQPYSHFRKGGKTDLPSPLYIGLTAERTQIYQRIEERVDLMMASGLLQEAQQLLPYKDLNALNTVGYKELFLHLQGEVTLAEAVEEIKKNTRRFAKRQLTWYRKNKDIHWLPSQWSKERKLALADNWSQGNTNPPLIVVMGVSGSGKSTLARALAEHFKIEFLDADDFHPATNIAKMKSGKPLNDKDRHPWLQALALEMLNRQDKGAVLACSALKESYRELLSEYVPLEVVYLKGSYETIYERMSARKGHFMPPELLQSQFRALEEPQTAIDIPLEWSTEQGVKYVDEILS